MDNLQTYSVPTFDELQREHRSFIFGFIHKKIGDWEVAEDLTQEVLAKVYFALPRYRPDGPIKAWLTQIAKNHIATYWRKGKVSMVPIEVYEGGEWRRFEVLSNEPPVSKWFEDHELSDMIKKALARLPAKLKRPFLLKYEQEMTYEEIADIMDIPEATARIRAFRAKNRLRDLLQATS